MQLLTVAEVAARLRVSRPYAYKLIAQGRLPAIRLGERCVRVPAEELERVLRERLEESG